MKTLFIGNLAPEATEEELTELFAGFGTVRKIELPRDIFTGRNKGFAFIGMEGHEARAAMAGLNGKPFKDKMLKVRDEKPKPKGRGGRRR
jgi:RNA recognition motif-containing protein